MVAKQWRINNLEKVKADARRRRAAEPPEYNWARHLKIRYGLTIGEYQAMAEAQGHGCAICGDPPRDKRLSVDHDHVTGKVRGLLCERCNSMLGRVKDDPMVLVAAAAYLEDSAGNQVRLDA